MLFALAVVVIGVIVEIAVILQAGEKFGGLEVLVALVLLSASGAWFIKYEGLHTMRKVGAAVAAGRMPTTELLYGLLGLVSGILLFIPGFLSAALGIFLAIPPFRKLMLPVILAVVSARVSRRVRLVGTNLGDEGFGMDGDPFGSNRRRSRGSGADDDVIDLDAEEYFPDDPAGELGPGESET